MFCRKCGAQIPENARFCEQCGAELISSKVNQEETLVVESNESKENKRLNLKKMIAGVAAIAVLAGGVGGFLFNKNLNKKVNVFAEYADTFKAIETEYMLGTEEEAYNSLCAEAEKLIAEKEVNNIEDLTSAMEEKKSQIIEMNEKIAEYKNIYDTFYEKVGDYILNEEEKTKCEELCGNLQLALEKFDKQESQQYSEELTDFEMMIREQSIAAIEEILEEIEAFDNSNFYEVESTIAASYITEGENAYHTGNYAAAYSSYQNYTALINETTAASNYYMLLEQVDETSYPITKLYLKAVSYRTGDVIDNLDSQKFTIWEKTENGYEQKNIAKLSIMDEFENLNIGIVADVSASMGNAMSVAEDAMYSLVSNMQFGIGDRAALYSFSDSVQREQYFTSDETTLKNAIYRLEKGNLTALYDALAFSLSEIIVQDGAKCIIAFTDGIENASVSSLEYVVQKAVQYHVPIYMIGIGRGVDSQDLEKIANSTGGMYININNTSEMSKIYETIYREQKARYVLEYTTTENLDLNTEREIFVKYNDGNNIIRMESSYRPSDYTIGGFIFHDSDSRYLTQEELNRLTEAEVRIALNEIYARRGYIFQTAEDMKAHFSRMDWYTGTETSMSVIEQNFNKFEEKNVNLLVNYEIVNKLNGRVK